MCPVCECLTSETSPWIKDLVLKWIVVWDVLIPIQIKMILNSITCYITRWGITLYKSSKDRPRDPTQGKYVVWRKTWWTFHFLLNMFAGGAHLKAFGWECYLKPQVKNKCGGGAASSFATAQQGNNSQILWDTALFWLIQELNAQLHVKSKRKCKSGYSLCRGLINWLSLTLNYPPGARCPFDASKLTTLGCWRPLTTPVVASGL